MKNKKIGVVVVVLVVVAVALLAWSVFAPSQLDAFAACLGEKNATFYGAYWCPNCESQKELFGGAEKHLPYIECSLPDRGGQTEECSEAGIRGYPTWKFGDGSRITGVLTVKELSERTGCVLP